MLALAQLRHVQFSSSGPGLSRISLKEILVGHGQVRDNGVMESCGVEQGGSGASDPEDSGDDDTDRLDDSDMEQKV